MCIGGSDRYSNPTNSTREPKPMRLWKYYDFNFSLLSKQFPMKLLTKCIT